MRIIGGKFRGKKLASFLGDDVRPTSDRGREAVFNILQFDIASSIFLDGFAGTGAIGIEAISHGASEVVFCDISSKSVDLVKKNLASINEKATVLIVNVVDYLSQSDKRFDIIFLDPPYATDDGVKALNVIASKDCLNDNGIVILEHKKAPHIEISGLKFVKSYNYGIAQFDYYKR